MSASSNRSSSAVRDLRNIFENKASENLIYDPRGRSPSGLSGSEKENSRPQSKIRASFVPVELAPNMADKTEQNKAQDASVQKGSIDERRPSFAEGAEGGPLTDMKEAVTEEQERRERDKSVTEPVPETAVESAVPTPAVQKKEDPIAEAPVLESDLPSANPDKPVTGAEEEPGAMKPADPTNAEAVSGGDGLPPATEDLRKPSDIAPSAAPKTVPKPSAISTKTQAKPTPSAKSPVSTRSAKTISPSPRSSQHSGSSRPPRASLTAPTAASAAKTAPVEKNHTTTPAKAKAREPTKPVELSSRLTAPTAAFKAKHETEPVASSTTTSRQSLATRSLPQASRATPRSSLAGGIKPETNGTSKKIGPAPDASFLERMMRPTAASQSKVHDKAESKSPPPKSKPVPRKPKPAAAKPTDNRPATESVLEDNAQPEPETAESSAAAGNEATNEAAEPAANSTPVPANRVQEQVDALEATPASLDDEIR